jgi:hypothetical protein
VKKISRFMVASISLAFSLAFASSSATAALEPPAAAPASVVDASFAAEPFAAPDALRSNRLFDQEELAELAALESRHTELQEQRGAGVLGGTASTILVVVLVLVLLL